MNKREAGLVARAVALIDEGGYFEAVRILRPLAGPKTPGMSFKPISRITRPKAKRLKPRRGRVIDKPYKAWISGFLCMCCFPAAWKDALENNALSWLTREAHGYTSLDLATEVAHVGVRGLGQKCSDRETVPLCKQHHTEGKESERALGKRFWSFHGLDKAEVIKALNAEYERRAA